MLRRVDSSRYGNKFLHKVAGGVGINAALGAPREQRGVGDRHLKMSKKTTVKL